METKSPKGTRDLLPAEMIVRQKIIKIIRSVFEAYGFSPLETPAFEYAALLEGKYGEQEKLIYKFRDRAGRALALRYDLTIPLIRVVGARPNLPKPIKRYCIGRVWRYDRPQRGRYREFWQCDVDIVGVPSALADAEVLTCVAAALKRLGLNRFRVRVNSRTVLESVAQWAGVPKRLNIELFRTLDKLDKIGIQGIKKELTSKGVDSSAINKSIKIIQIKGSPKVVSAKL